MATARQPNNYNMASVDSNRRVAEGLTSTTTTALAFAAAITTTSSSGPLQQPPGKQSLFRGLKSNIDFHNFSKDHLGRYLNRVLDHLQGRIGRPTIMGLGRRGRVIFMGVTRRRPRLSRKMRLLDKPISLKEPLEDHHLEGKAQKC